MASIWVLGDTCFKLLPFIALSSTRPLGVMSMTRIKIVFSSEVTLIKIHNYGIKLGGSCQHLISLT
jgi:hypothetical protein